MPEENEELKQDGIFKALRFLEDCMIFYKQMHDLPTCNECAKQKDCVYVPGWGERVRYNCPHFMQEAKKDA